MNVSPAPILSRSPDRSHFHPRGHPLLQVPSYNSSITDGIWSHGSSYEQFGDKIQQAHKTDYRQKEAKTDAPVYKYENGGIVVYDSRAHVFGDPEPVQKASVEDDLRELNSGRKRSLDLAAEPDKKRYATMKTYSPYPNFETDFEIMVPPDSLRFESRFESGNLRRAIRMMETDYSLLLQEDTGTDGHTQWFYFSVSNAFAGTYTFHVLNLYKTGSLYSEGMLPTVLSQKRQQKEGIGWHHAGTGVGYEENSYEFGKPGKHSTLTFTYRFDYDGDTVYFAHSVPYTYSDLLKWMDRIKFDYPEIARVNGMCQTLAGNVCDMVTITEDIRSYKSFETEAMEWHMSLPARKFLRSKSDTDSHRHRLKKGVILTARVHPGETVGSHMLKGAVDFLLSNSPEAVNLRRFYVFKIVPMLNPDGVRYGNYRCSLLGVDLNRRWLNPSKQLHPTIFYTKRMTQVFAEEHEIALFCDFHGHSCKRNVFMYGCSRPPLNFENRKANISAKVLPLLLTERNKMTAWKDCHFRMEKSKEATARSVVCTEFNIMQSYTIEASFYGPSSMEAYSDFSRRTDLHMTLADYEKIGADLLKTSACFGNEELFLGALSKVKDILMEEQKRRNPEAKEIWGSEKGVNNSMKSAHAPESYPDEQLLWELLVDLDTIEDDYAPSGESDSSSSSDSESISDRKLKKRSEKPSPRANLEIKSSSEGLEKDENDSIFSRRASYQSKAIKSERQTPIRSPLVVSSKKYAGKKGIKGKETTPTPKNLIIAGELPDFLMNTEPSAESVSEYRKPLEVRGHTRFFHRNQMRTKKALARPKSQKKSFVSGSEKSMSMIETMRKALRHGAMKPLLCSPVCPGLSNFIVENARTSEKRLKTVRKTRSPET